MFVDDDVFALKEDLEQCIVSNTEFEGKYHFFLFDKSVMGLINGFGCFENLTISSENNLIKLKGKIAEDIKSIIDMESMNQRVWKKNATNFIKQIQENKKTEAQKNNERIMAKIQFNNMMNEISYEEFEYRELSQNDKNILLNIKTNLLDIGWDLDYEEHKEMAMLCGNYEQLQFDKYELRHLISLIEKDIDIFSITPYYDENEDKCIGIRVVIGINLIKGA